MLDSLWFSSRPTNTHTVTTPTPTQDRHHNTGEVTETQAPCSTEDRSPPGTHASPFLASSFPTNPGVERCMGHWNLFFFTFFCNSWGRAVYGTQEFAIFEILPYDHPSAAASLGQIRAT